jgi:hypothetical protein
MTRQGGASITLTNVTKVTKVTSLINHIKVIASEAWQSMS